MLSLWFWAHVQWLEKTVLAECFCERAKELWHSPTHSSRQRNLQILCPKFPKQEKYKCNSLLQSVYLRISIAIFQNPPPNRIPPARPEKESKHVFVKHYAVEKKPCQIWDIFAFKTKNRNGNIWWKRVIFKDSVLVFIGASKRPYLYVREKRHLGVRDQEEPN